MKNFVLCQKCLKKYDIKLETYNVLSLDIRKININTINDAMDDFFGSEDVEGIFIDITYRLLLYEMLTVESLM